MFAIIFFLFLRTVTIACIHAGIYMKMKTFRQPPDTTGTIMVRCLKNSTAWEPDEYYCIVYFSAQEFSKVLVHSSAVILSQFDTKSLFYSCLKIDQAPPQLARVTRAT